MHKTDTGQALCLLRDSILDGGNETEIKALKSAVNRAVTRDILRARIKERTFKAGPDFGYIESILNDYRTALESENQIEQGKAAAAILGLVKSEDNPEKFIDGTFQFDPRQRIVQECILDGSSVDECKQKINDFNLGMAIGQEV